MQNKISILFSLLLLLVMFNGCKEKGCTDPNSLNFDPDAQKSDGSCIDKIEGCTDIAALNYDEFANFDDGSCIYNISGCTDSAALNYNAAATLDDGSCIFPVIGCMDSTATNFNPDATVDDGSCIIPGCMDSTALNYNPNATVDDGSCIAPIEGCMDSNAVNFNPLANVADGSCTYATDDYVGAWTVVTDDWSSAGCGGGVETYTMNLVAGSLPHQVVINNFGNAIEGMTFNTFTDSIVAIDRSGFFDRFNHQWDLVMSRGVMDADTMRFIYHLNDEAYSPLCYNLYGDVVAVKQ